MIYDGALAYKDKQIIGKWQKWQSLYEDMNTHDNLVTLI